MQGRTGHASLKLLGVLRLERPDGEKIEITSKRGQALLAMLALAENGERARSWLQSMLWSDRSREQASASLRRELSTLRKTLSAIDADLLSAHGQTVQLDLSQLDVDVRSEAQANADELLEGLDIRGAEGFEDWLRTERARRAGAAEDNARGDAAGPAPALRAIDNPHEIFLGLPAMAVLRFSSQPASEANEVIADGLAEDFIDRLSQLRWLPVISRNTSFAIGHGDPREIGAQLGARYLLGGRMAVNDGQTTMRLTLDDAARGRTLWTETFELGEKPTHIGFADLATKIAAAVEIRIDREEQVKALDKDDADLTTSELVWRGRWHLARLTPSSNEMAKQCFEEALERQPNLLEARIQLVWLTLRQLWLERGAEADIRTVRRDAQKIILADGEDARGHMLAGIAEVFLRQPLRAERLLRQAIDLNPCLAMAHAQLGGALILRGESGEAERFLRNAIRLSPSDSDMFFFRGELALARLYLGDPQSALDEAETSLSMRAGYWIAHCTKIAALLDLEQEAEAQRAFAEFRTEQPDFNTRQIDWLPAVDPFICDKLKAGLNRAEALSD